MTTEQDKQFMAQRRETGLKLVGQMVGPEAVKTIREKIAADNFGSSLLEMTMDQCYTDIWSREGLSLKERSLVTLGVLIALKAEWELPHQMKIALRNGLTPRQLEEVILQALTYVGIPAANLADRVAVRALGELGLKTENRSQDD